MQDLNGNKFDLKSAVDALYAVYGDEYDNREAVYELASYLQWLYESEGNLDKFLRKPTTGYKRLINGLVMKAR